jgi:RNA polymerase sigma-70 factor (ECF subfamily)
LYGQREGHILNELLKYSEKLMQEGSEKEWIERAKENPRWFEPLYDKYFAQIFKFLFKRHADETVTGEICSEVFYKALMKISKYKEKGHPFSSWLYKIALNESNQFFRKQKFQRVIPLDLLQAENLFDEFPLEDSIQQLELLKKALQTLKSKELEVIELRFFNNLSFKEVASVLNITENNAKVRCYRILDKLRIKMKVK